MGDRIDLSKLPTVELRPSVATLARLVELKMRERDNRGAKSESSVESDFDRVLRLLVEDVQRVRFDAGEIMLEGVGYTVSAAKEVADQVLTAFGRVGAIPCPPSAPAARSAGVGVVNESRDVVY